MITVCVPVSPSYYVALFKIFTISAAYLKGLPLPRLPMVLEEKEKERERGGDEGSRPNEVEGGIRLEKSNILILGPTGSGEPPTML